jgi:hypothetical protein
VLILTPSGKRCLPTQRSQAKALYRYSRDDCDSGLSATCPFTTCLLSSPIRKESSGVSGDFPVGLSLITVRGVESEPMRSHFDLAPTIGALTRLYASEVRQRFQLGDPSGVQKALQRLSDLELIETVRRGTYLVPDLFLRAWLREPPER